MITAYSRYKIGYPTVNTTMTIANSRYKIGYPTVNTDVIIAYSRYKTGYPTVNSAMIIAYSRCISTVLHRNTCRTQNYTDTIKSTSYYTGRKDRAHYMQKSQIT
jgi:hypothetical protein